MYTYVGTTSSYRISGGTAEYIFNELYRSDIAYAQAIRI